jgi:hypothetical protein
MNYGIGGINQNCSAISGVLQLFSTEAVHADGLKHARWATSGPRLRAACLATRSRTASCHARPYDAIFCKSVTVLAG